MGNASSLSETPGDSTRANSGLGALYALTVFVSAFLLFQVQPLISRYILPWFGGTPAVWTTCMLFFQMTLFAGYAYAHFAAARLSAWTQALLHLLLLGGALALLPIIPDAAWKPTGNEQPIWRIVSLLAATVGLPFFVLSTSGPLLQHWFSRTEPGRSPYRLYALSNVGSLLALLSYPFVVEPLLSTTMQARVWSWSFAGFAAICALTALRMAGKANKPFETNVLPEFTPQTAPVSAVIEDTSPSIGRVLLWFLLAMVPSILLLAITSQVCLDVASVPFLWIVPLSLYLMSFILCFDSDRWYSRVLFVPAAFILSGGVAAALIGGAGVDLWLQAAVHFGALFAIAMVCHGELVRLKPDPRHLTAFYLVISAGGAAGGLFAGVLAPLVFQMYLELHIGLVAFGILCLIVLYRDLNQSGFQIWPPTGGSLAWMTMFNATVAIAVAVGVHVHRDTTNAVSVSRNFYGVLRVLEKRYPEQSQSDTRELMHGRILHGMQFLDPERKRIPTTYYSHASGVGRILSNRPPVPRRLGFVGLGAGTLATYAEPGDIVHFYDINPEVVRLARSYFTYLADCMGDVEFSMGDARLSLENQESQQFDVLALDAFSSDAIPIHLLTVEAAEIYLRHLKQDGVLAIHISNRHFNLRPVVDALVDHFKLASATVESLEDEELGDSVSVWVLLSRELEPLTVNLILESASEEQPKRILWTDDRSNLVEVLRLLEPEEELPELPAEAEKPTTPAE
ncbi:MAG: spermidine synthase [Planctomycetaceae bacterium]